MDRQLEELRATLNMIQAYTRYAILSDTLDFVNERCADYIGLAKDHPLRLGTDTGAAWDSHLLLLHPDDREQTWKVWSECLTTGRAGEVTFHLPDAKGGAPRVPRSLFELGGRHRQSARANRINHFR